MVELSSHGKNWKEANQGHRTVSWLMHFHAVAECLPLFAAAEHGNYVKLA